MMIKGAYMPSTQTLVRHLSSLLLVLLLGSTSTAWAQDNGDGAPSAEDLSETQTAFYGARLLCGPLEESPACPRAGRGEVSFSRVEVGDYDDFDGRDRYSFWAGDSLFAGVIDDESGNRVDAVAEFYWFESSVPRDSDFYVVVLKVAAAPNQTSNWRIATDPSIVDNLLFRDIGPIHRVKAMVERNGNFGAIRWDWSVPHQNYRWEPAQVIEVEQEYTAGANVEGNAMRSVTEGVNIQAKGYLNAMAKVSTRYTITLWRWEMRVQPGATDMIWNLTALDPEHDLDPAYHEYFLVIQAPRGREARLEGLDFGGTFRERRAAGLMASFLTVLTTFPSELPTSFFVRRRSSMSARANRARWRNVYPSVSQDTSPRATAVFSIARQDSSQMAIDVFPNVAKDSKLMVTNAPQSAEMASVTVTVVACLTAAKGYDWTITLCSHLSRG